MFNRVEIKEKAKAIYKSNVVRALLIGFVLWLISEGGSSTNVNIDVDGTSQMIQENFYQLNTSHLFNILPFAVAGFSIILVLISLLLSPIKTMLMYYYKDMTQGIESPNIMEVVERGVFFKVALITIISRVVISIGYILLIFPGIYLTYAWRYVGLIAVDHPELSISEVFAESKQMTMGNKMNLFILDLSFFGWIILIAVASFLTFGIAGVIGSILLMPYTSLSDVEAYNVLSLEE